MCSSDHFHLHPELSHLTDLTELYDDIECPVCFTAESNSSLTKLRTPSCLSPDGVRKCSHKVCEECLIRMYMSDLYKCPLCNANWTHYFGNLSYRVQSYTDSLYQLLFKGVFLDKSEYIDSIRKMYKEHGRRYCLGILVSDWQRLIRC